jgi:hypothetical protein
LWKFVFNPVGYATKHYQGNVGEARYQPRDGIYFGLLNSRFQITQVFLMLDQQEKQGIQVEAPRAGRVTQDDLVQQQQQQAMQQQQMMAMLMAQAGVTPQQQLMMMQQQATMAFQQQLQQQMFQWQQVRNI